nr:hypothetical protein HUO10_004428 [Paraburkholderia busanensis]
MPVTSNRNAVIGHRCVAFLDHVGRDVGVPRAGYTVALASDEAPVKAHHRRARFNLAVVVGVITDADQIHHVGGLFLDKSFQVVDSLPGDRDQTVLRN